MKRMILWASDAVDTIVLRCATIALVALVAVVLLQVASRYVFFQPPIWTEEVSRYLMIWAGLLGATLSFKRFFDPSIFRPDLSYGLRRASMFLQSVAVLVFVLPGIYYSVFGPGMRLTRGYLMRHARMYSETLELTTVFVAMAVPLSLIVILLHLAARWAGELNEPTTRLQTH